MIDAAQFFLLLIILVLAVLLFVLGIQVFLILKDLRTTVKRANKVLGGVEKITDSISEPIASISSLLAGIKAGQIISSILKKREEERNGEHEQ